MEAIDKETLIYTIIIFSSIFITMIILGIYGLCKFLKFEKEEEKNDQNFL